METNALILNSNWLWQGSGNGNLEAPAFWVDFLDDPLVAALKTIFFEVRDEEYKEMPIKEGSHHENGI